MGKNVEFCKRTKQKAKKICRCKKAKKEDIDVVYVILKEFLSEIKKQDIDIEKNVYIIDDDRQRVTFFTKIGYRHYMLACASKLPEARGPKNIKFLYESVVYMFLYTDAIVVDTIIDKENKKSIMSARLNPGGQVIEDTGKELRFRWTIGSLFHHVSPSRQKKFIKNMQASRDRLKTI